MSLINKLFALLILSLSLSANANISIKAIILNDETILSLKDISAINFDENFDRIHSVELFDESIIDSSDIKSIILKGSNHSLRFRGGIEYSAKASSNGNGSGG